MAVHDLGDWSYCFPFWRWHTLRISWLQHLCKLRHVAMFSPLGGDGVGGFLTTLPECLVSLVAVHHDHVGIAIGNALGSYVANIGMVLGAVRCFIHYRWIEALSHVSCR